MKVKYVTDGSGQSVGVSFYCPGCQGRHTVNFGWQFNGDLDKPTLSPSILVRSGHYTREPAVPGECYCDYHERFPDKEPPPWKCYCCHSFVTDGNIFYCPDTTHALAGQTVPLPDLETLS